LSGVELRLDAAVSHLVPDRQGRGGYTVTISGVGEPVDCDGVILTAPLDVTAGLLRPFEADIAGEMGAVDYATVALITLAVPLDQLDQPLDGSGFLVAQPEGLLVTACSWASSKWAHLTDPDVAILRASVGRADDTRAAEMSDAELTEQVRADLETTMGLTAAPTEARITRWPRALPQLGVGHLDRAVAWQRQIAGGHPGLAVAGAGVAGLGIPACIAQGRQAARTVLDRLDPGA
jgi:oxygen-dependent protoporphyrinogen oxidase